MALNLNNYKRISDLVEKEELADEDSLAIDNSSETSSKRITFAKISKQLKTKLGIGTLKKAKYITGSSVADDLVALDAQVDSNKTSASEKVSDVSYENGILQQTKNNVKSNVFVSATEVKSGDTNPVTSGAVYTATNALQETADKLILPVTDSTPVSYNQGDFFIFGGVLYRASKSFENVTITASNITDYATAQTQTALNAMNANINAINDTLSQVSTEQIKYYGMIIHQNIQNPSDSRVEYIGKNKNYKPFTMNLTNGTWDAGSWGEMPTLIKNKPAMIKTDGTFDYWLDESDYTKRADGQASDVANTAYDGNAFAWFEPLWIRMTASGDDIEVRFAYEQLDDSYVEVCPEHCGLWIPMFYGCVVNGKMRSIANTSVLGATTGNTTTDAQHTSISANGDNYLFFGGKVADAISLLKVLWSKSTNTEFWGLGNQSGYVDDSSKAYGTKGNPVVGGGQFYGTSDGKSANKFMHSVVLQTQDVWLRDPYFICDHKRFKVSTDYHYDATGATYTDTGIDHGGQGYIEKFTPSNGFLLPTTQGGSSSTYYCDHTWLNANIVAVLLRFANCRDGATGGFFALHYDNVAGASWWSNGSAAMLKQSL